MDGQSTRKEGAFLSLGRTRDKVYVIAVPQLNLPAMLCCAILAPHTYSSEFYVYSSCD